MDKSLISLGGGILSIDFLIKKEMIILNLSNIILGIIILTWFCNRFVYLSFV